MTRDRIRAPARCGLAGEGGRGHHRVRLALDRAPPRPDHAVGHVGRHVPQLLARQDPGVEPAFSLYGHLLFHSSQLRGVVDEEQAAVGLDLQVDPELFREPAPNGQRAEDEGQGREEVSGPFRAFLVVRNGLDLAVEAAGVPAGGLRAYLGTLEEHDAGPRPSEVVGGGTTGDAPTDHSDVEL